MPIIKITIPSFETSEAQVNENKSNNYQKINFSWQKLIFISLQTQVKN